MALKLCVHQLAQRTRYFGLAEKSSVRRRHGGQDIHRPVRNASSPSRLARSSSWLPPTNPHDHVEIAITLMRAFGRLHLFDIGPENGVVRRQFADAKLPPRIACVQIACVSRHPSPPQQGQLVGKRKRAARGSQPLTRLVTFPGVNPFGRSVVLGDQLGGCMADFGETVFVIKYLVGGTGGAEGFEPLTSAVRLKSCAFWLAVLSPPSLADFRRIGTP